MVDFEIIWREYKCIMFKFNLQEPLFFDDTKSIKELIHYAFNEFDYYEPAGMEIVTLFQPQSRTSTGWFTTDTSRLCVDEIEDAEILCFCIPHAKCILFC